MQMVDKIILDFVPEKLIATDLFTYRDYFYFFYQYQKKNVVYCMVAKLKRRRKNGWRAKELDTTNVNYLPTAEFTMCLIVKTSEDHDF